MAEDIREQLLHLFFRMRKATGRIHTGKLTNAMLSAMLRIEAHGGQMGIKPSDMCQIMGISMPALVRTLKELEQLDMVERIQDTLDRRVFYVKLTQNGRDELHRGRQDIDRRLTRLLEIIGPEDAENLLRIVKKVTTALEEVRQEDTDI